VLRCVHVKNSGTCLVERFTAPNCIDVDKNVVACQFSAKIISNQDRGYPIRDICAIKCSWQLIPRHGRGALTPVIWNETAEKAVLVQELCLHVRNSSMENCIYTRCGEVESTTHQHNTSVSLLRSHSIGSFYLFLNPTPKQLKSVKMDAIVQAILNLSKLEVSLIKIEDATPE
jgi:hypothetical protein